MKKEARHTTDLNLRGRMALLERRALTTPATKPTATDMMAQTWGVVAVIVGVVGGVGGGGARGLIGCVVVVIFTT